MFLKQVPIYYFFRRTSPLSTCLLWWCTLRAVLVQLIEVSESKVVFFSRRSTTESVVSGTTVENWRAFSLFLNFFPELSRWMRALDLRAFSNTSRPLKYRCCMPLQGWQLFTAEFVKLCGGVAWAWWIGGIVTAVTVVSSGTAALCEKLLDCLRQWTPARIGLI